MYIVVVGGGMVGFHLTRALFNAGHEVFIVDTDGKRVEELIKHFGNVAIKGDGSEPSIQIAAGVARADILIATTGVDEDNLAACQLAKHQFNVPKTVTLINNPEDENLFDYRISELKTWFSHSKLHMKSIWVLENEGGAIRH